MNLGKRIVRWRDNVGLSQTAVAAKLGISPEAVCQWEHGDTTPTTKHLQKLTKVFGITLERFYGEVPPAKKKARAA